MGICRLTKKRRGLINRKTSISFQLLVIVYLLFCAISQLTSPTTANFNDTERINGNVSTADTFGGDKKQENVNHHNQPSQADKQTGKNNANQDRDNKHDNQDQEKNGGKAKGDQDGSRLTEIKISQKATESKETTNTTLKSETSDHSSMASEKTGGKTENVEEKQKTSSSSVANTPEENQKPKMYRSDGLR